MSMTGQKNLSVRLLMEYWAILLQIIGQMLMMSKSSVRNCGSIKLIFISVACLVNSFICFGLISPCIFITDHLHYISI